VNHFFGREDDTSSALPFTVAGFFLDLGRRAGTKVGRQVTIDRVFAL
jgi:hypothetical protein